MDGSESVSDLDQESYVELEIANSKRETVDEDQKKPNPTPAKPPMTKTEKLKKAILPTEGKLASYIFGIAFDVVGLIIWFALIFTVLTEPERNSAWYLPFIGVIGATVAMATPAGGGVFYFPVLTLFGITPDKAVAFNLATSSISMGIFGTVTWIRKSRRSIIPWVVGVVIPSGWIGTLFSLFLPIHGGIALRVVFTVFCLILFIYVVYLLCKGKTKEQEGNIDMKNPLHATAMIATGLIGGVVVGYIGVGVDMLTFMILNAVFKIDSRKAIATSVIIMGWTAIFPFLFRIIGFPNVTSPPIPLWIMGLGGVVVGARLGVLTNKLIGRRNVMILFSLLLIAEVIRTPVELILESQSSNSTL
eukprot:TRINITY_DN7108_c0_g1_i1.p1 TRINITY_DN7108_c0_g1~~TRINITY_DN7108_c0_g1_i1.p1  ORF type:complete len:361 (-),score=43.58 TRINITY_DN7108_c0_g1_i1:81-1163(-)